MKNQNETDPELGYDAVLVPVPGCQHSQRGRSVDQYKPVIGKYNSKSSTARTQFSGECSDSENSKQIRLDSFNRSLTSEDKHSNVIPIYRGRKAIVLIALCCAVAVISVAATFGLRRGPNRNVNTGSNVQDEDETDIVDEEIADKEIVDKEIVDKESKTLDPQKPTDLDDGSNSINAVGTISSFSGLFSTTANQPLQASLATFGSQSLTKYNDCEELKEDIFNAAKVIVNQEIKSNAELNYDYRYYFSDTETAAAEPETTQDVDKKSGTGGAKTKESSYGTNNQVEGVDEADVVKSTETHTFAAYGDLIVVWDVKTGAKLSTTKMPIPENPEAELADNINNGDSKVTYQKGEGNIGMLRIGVPHNPVPKISAMLMHKDRLAVIVTIPNTYQWNAINEKILNEYEKVEIRLYDISPESIPLYTNTTQNKTYNPPELLFLGSIEINGSYNSARSIENMAHIVTKQGVNTYQHLKRHFKRWNPRFESMNSTEYITNATQDALSTIIPNFVDNVMKELSSTDDTDKRQCDHITRFSMFSSVDASDSKDAGDTNDSNMNANVTGIDGIEFAMPWLNDIFGGLGQITTIDMSIDNITNKTKYSNATSLTAGRNIFFLPSLYGTQVYASSDILLVATKGYKLSAGKSSSWRESTYIMAFGLGSDDNGKKTHSVVGMTSGIVPGYLINQWAMDVWDGHIRVASTHRGRWGCSYQKSESGMDDSLEHIGNDTDLSFVTSPCVWTMLEDTDNHISVLKIPDVANASSNSKSVTSMSTVGFLDNLGEEGERIEAVRFMEEKAFLVTFRRTDPFYTIDMTNHTNPRVLGELKITGFSNYLHPYDNTGKTLLAVGQDANDQGRPIGLQISLFNVTDLANPKLLDRYSVTEQADNKLSWIWSSSEAQYDHKAFRFLPQSKKLIIPASIRNYSHNDFDGFLIFNVHTEQNIKLDFKVNHVNPKDIFSGCWYHAYLSGRSTVHNGTVTTMKGHSILVHDLDTRKKIWELDLDENNKECSGNYWF